ncbi:MAG TPA: signal recognition particle-docking protein FtsY [Gammaproteobacteria bacterium]|nr:signal recognition particle-docking protein FtsY [Gammaproteobacteria bacterium]
MFGSGDDKNSKKPADNADSLSSDDQQSEAVPEAPAKKGLFSWFGRKKAESKAEQPSAAETTLPEETEQSAELEQPTVESVAEPVEQAAASIVAEQQAEETPAATELEAQPEVVLPIAEVVAAAETDAAPEEAVESELAPAAEQSLETKSSRFSLFGGRKAAEPQPVQPAAEVQPELEPEPEVEPEPEPKAVEQDPPLAANLAGQSKPQGNKLSWFARLKQGLAKTSSSLGEGMASLFLGKKEIDDDLLEELETRLLTADVGMEATTAIMDNLTRRVARKELADSGALYQALQGEMVDLLRPVEQPMTITGETKPYVILVVGVNGAGKTTTIGKLAQRLQKEGKKVMLAAGDTFRAAAVEQLQVWGERNNVPVIAQHTGADSASVIFDAVQAAQSRGMDVLIADTAGRLHTKDNLMEELRKVARVMGRLDDSAPHEVLLVLDAGTGQNAINQTRHFNETIPVTGLALTKLDGTAKGGVIFALAKHFAIPVRYIGVGEGIDDLRDFVADDFVAALFAEKDSA